MTIGQRVRDLRLEAGLSQEALCAKAGTSYSTLLRLERHNQVPKIAILREIASALNVPMAYLLEAVSA